MTHIYHFRLWVVLLLCCTSTITFAQSDNFQTIPESLRGYWEYKTDNVSDWKGPLIGENFIECYYTVFYAEQMTKEADGSYFFHLRNQKGDKMDFRITRPEIMTVPTFGIRVGKNPAVASVSKFLTTLPYLLQPHCQPLSIKNGSKG